MKSSAAAALAVLGAAGSGCATIIEGTTQSVSVNTDPVQRAQCTLNNSQGTWYITSPGSVVVHKTKTDLTVTCSKEGYVTKRIVATSHFKGTTAGNVVFGVVGAPVGAGVDAASGANFYYESPLIVPLTERAAAGGQSSPFPISMHCSRPSTNADILPDGPEGYVTAIMRFDVNSADHAGAVQVTPAQDGFCTVDAPDGIVVRSASVVIDGASSWNAGEI